MARPISWLGSVRENLRSVTNSQRSHYDAADVAKLLDVHRRTAQGLLELMPREGVGQAYLVKREDLSAFLVKVRDAGKEADVRKLLEQLRTQPPPITRKKIRGLVRHEADAINTNSLPNNMRLRRGRLEIDWRRPEQLAEAMLFIAKIVETPEFDQEFCHSNREVETTAIDLEALDAKFFREEVIRLEQLNKDRHAGQTATTPATTPKEAINTPYFACRRAVADNPPSSASLIQALFSLALKS